MSISRFPAGTGRGGLLVLVLALAVAYAWPIQEIGWSQKANYALVRSLASGTPRIDRYNKETGDKSYFDSHFYSVKAPGLPLVSVPAYVVLDRTGLLPGDERVAVWLLNLLTVVPFALLLFAVTLRAGRLLVGEGVAGATAIAVATIVLPFATMYFSHVPAAALVALAFLIALRARGDGSPHFAFAAGLAGGLAVVFEYPSALACLTVGTFLVATTAPRLRIGAAFAAGAVVGVVPLLVFNQWAFGSPTHLSYEHVVDPSSWQDDVPHTLPTGSLGFTTPSLHTAAELLLSYRGLATITPVLLAGVVSILVLYRRGRRAEALLIGGTAAATLLWNSGFTAAYGGAFGGDSPGARYMLCILPLVLIPLGLVVERAARTVLVLTVISAIACAIVTATQPQVGVHEQHLWLDLLRSGSFQETPLTLLGLGSGWLSMLPFFVALGVVAVTAWRLAGSPFHGPLLGAFAAGGAWLVLLGAAPRLLDSPGGGTGAALALLVLFAVVAVATYSHVESGRRDPTPLSRGGPPRSH